MFEILQLRYFEEVVKSGSITEAAKRLGIPQPSLSQTIRRLEKEVGIDLFERAHRRTTLNTYGEIFHNHVSQALMILDNGMKRINDLSGSSDSTINMYVSEHRNNVFACISKFMGDNSAVKFKIYHGATFDTPPSFDIAVSANPDFGIEYDREVLLVEPIKLAIPLGHRFSDRESILLSELAGESFITLTNGSSITQLFKDTMHSVGIEPEIIAYCGEDPQLLFKCLALGLGIAMVPTVSWGTNLVNARMIDISNVTISRNIYLYTRKGRYLTKIQRLFISYIHDFFEELTKK